MFCILLCYFVLLQYCLFVLTLCYDFLCCIVMLKHYYIIVYISFFCRILLYCSFVCNIFLCLVILFSSIMLLFFNIMLFSNIILLFFNITMLFCILLSRFVTLYHSLYVTILFRVLLCCFVMIQRCFIDNNIVVCLIILF